ncbi:MAG: aspartate carbamoyltransferase catalytic subunit [Phycisphaerae bacterium]|nr:aspartate carbamoyltransferase catalytic subunit [Phycisphaerae bacterium]
MTRPVRPRPLPRRPAAPARATDLLGLAGLPADDIRGYLTAARSLSTEGVKPVLAGKVIANVFLEDSTRTRTSFGIAARRLGAHVVDLIGASSSVNKGETLIDTARNIEAMGVGGIIVRASQSGAAALMAAAIDVPVINAGDGRHEHPTQGLLDLFTIAQCHGRMRHFDLGGLTVAIVGDLSASRVARSDIAGLTALGARVVCIGPPPMAPAGLASLGDGTNVSIERDLDRVLPRVDAVIMLRIQFERAGESKPAAGAPLVARAPGIASIREYRERYGLSSARAAQMKPSAVVLHPGPINRGIELDESVADGPRSVILRQVTNGVLVRMAVLSRLCGGQ